MKTMSATDNDARIAVLEEIQDAMNEHGPFIMVAQAPSHIGYNTRLEGGLYQTLCPGSDS